MLDVARHSSHFETHVLGVLGGVEVDMVQEAKEGRLHVVRHLFVAQDGNQIVDTECLGARQQDVLRLGLETEHDFSFTPPKNSFQEILKPRSCSLVDTRW